MHQARESGLKDKRRARGRARFSVIALGCLVAAASLTAGATDFDDSSQAPPLKFSVSPLAGYRAGGSFKLTDTDNHATVQGHLSYGLALDLSTDQQASQYELFYSRQATNLSSPALASSDITIQYLHLGGTVLLAEPTERWQPYFLATLGGTRFSSDAAASIDKTYFSVSLGLGLKVPFNTHLALRLEARGFATFLNGNTAVFCRSDQAGGLCVIHGNGDAFFQGDALAGLVYTF